MDPRRCVGVATSAAFTALLAGCFGEESPTSFNDPTPPVTYDEDRGHLIASGVRRNTHGLIGPNWVFLGNASEIVYAIGTGSPGGGSLWSCDLDGVCPLQILDDLNVVQDLHYASVEDRIYIGQWQAGLSVNPDGSVLDTVSVDLRASLRVSPDGRYLLYARDSDGQALLIDRTEGDTIEVDTEPARVQMFEEHAVYQIGSGTSPTGVGVMDPTSGDTASATGLIANFGIYSLVDLGGPRDAPRITVIDDVTEGARVVTFTGDPATGTGATTDVLTVPRDSIWGSAYDNVKGGASPDGSRIAVSVLRDWLGGCFGEDCAFSWDILVIDVPTGDVRIVAYGVSTGEPTGFVFSPDASRLLYETDGRLYVVDLS